MPRSGARVARGDAHDRPGAADDPRDVGAVPDVVALTGAAEVRVRRDPAEEIGVGGVDPHVDDRDANAGALKRAAPERRDV